MNITIDVPDALVEEVMSAHRAVQLGEEKDESAPQSKVIQWLDEQIDAATEICFEILSANGE